MSNPQLTGWPISFPKSLYLRRPLKTRRDLRETSGFISEQDLTVGYHHLTIIQPKRDKITFYLDMVPDDHLTYNSIMEDCFMVRLSNGTFTDTHQKVTS